MTMTVRPALDIIAEWRNGCSCATPGRPEECAECSRNAIEALERWLRELPAEVELAVLSHGMAMVDAEMLSEAVEELMGLRYPIVKAG